MTGPQDPFAAPGGDAAKADANQPSDTGRPDLRKPSAPAAGPGYGPPPQQPGYGPPPGYGAPGAAGAPVLAEWGSRVGAFLIDLVLVSGLMIAAVIIGLLSGVVSEVLGSLVTMLGYLAALGFFFWQLVVQGNTGQTIGKKQMNIKLLREQDGQVVGGGLSIGRYFVHILDSLPCYLGYLWPLWDSKRQTFADKILQTVVIKA